MKKTFLLAAVAVALMASETQACHLFKRCCRPQTTSCCVQTAPQATYAPPPVAQASYAAPVPVTVQPCVGGNCPNQVPVQSTRRFSLFGR